MDTETIILIAVVLAAIAVVAWMATKDDKKNDTISRTPPRTPQQRGKPPYSDTDPTL